MLADEALEIAQQIVAGLAAAHRNGIVHRDLKPENIMLRVDGLVKLMDFGLAKFTRGTGILPVAPSEHGQDAHATTDSITESGAIVGTLTYMSPEQARGQPVTPASDVFSFGIVFYELLTAEHPFQAETAMDTLTAILSKDPVAVRAKSPAVPETVSAITARALEKDASRRYPSAVELLEDLKRARSATVAGSPGVAPSAVRPKPRWMQAVGATLITLILALAGWRFRSASTGIQTAPAVRSVAVMNFRTAPEDQSASTLAQELPEELDTALSRAGLQIASRESVLELATPGRPQDVGAQLGVDAVLEGSVRTYGARFKVHVELVSARTGFQVWSETITVEGEDVLSGEQKTAAEIAQELRQALAAK